MGNSHGFERTYAVPITGTESPGLSPVLRAATHPDGLVEDFADEQAQTSWGLLQRGKRHNGGENRCLGWRPQLPGGQLASDYTWLTYNEVEAHALAVGSGLLEIPGCMDPISFDDEAYGRAKELRFLGLFSKNRVEWLICEQASNAYNFALVPLYDTLGKEALEYILAHTKMRLVASTLECLPPLLNGIEATKFVKFILLFLCSHEEISFEIKSRCDSLGITILKYSDLLRLEKPARPSCPGTMDDINTICYTSGTTGRPKGVLLTHRNFVSCVVGVLRGQGSVDFRVDETEIHVSYLPLAHVLERHVCNAVLTIGGSIGFYSGDTAKLMDDIRVLRPTILVSVPRIFNRINDAINRGLLEKGAVAKYLFERGVKSKLTSLRTNATTTNLLWDPVVFNKTRALLGDRLRWMISGGAPLDAIIQDYMKVFFCVPMMEGFGMTETAGPAFLQSPCDPVSGHVGGIFPCNEFRLQSVPDMGYEVSDFPPRGELLIRGNAITPGYFRDPEETQQALDAEGWLRTGDIAILLPGGAVKVIDRRKNIFKLAQGEYVAPEKVEAVYLQAPMVSQIFVFGYSNKTALVGIVVPDAEAVRLWRSRKGDNDETGNDPFSLAAICVDPQLKKELMQEMELAASEAKLKGFEKVRDIFVEPEPFSIESNTLTPTLKIKRAEAKQKYQIQIDAMYEKLGG